VARLFVDTSAIYALLDRSDANHPRARELAQRIREEAHGLVTTNFVVAECHALILARLGRDLARRWLQSFRWPVERATEADESRAREIIYTYSDKDFSFTDALSFAVMERLVLKEAFAFDRNFLQYGFRLFGIP
jgi:predicted nucleic acid-binding protein